MRDGRYSSSQIEVQVAPMPRVVEEGAQRRRHKFRLLGMEAGRLALHKPDDVCCTECREAHGSIRKTVVENTADKRPIVGHRGRGKGAFVSQGQTKLVGALWRGCLRERHRVLCYGARVAQEGQEPRQRRRIAAPGALPVGSVSQGVLGVLWGGLVCGEALVLKPAAEVSHSSELQAS